MCRQGDRIQLSFDGGIGDNGTYVWQIQILIVIAINPKINFKPNTNIHEKVFNNETNGDQLLNLHDIFTSNVMSVWHLTF